MNENRKTGLWGEILAVRFLRDNGYIILNTNLRIGRAEIDIVCIKDGILCIVEVKTRSPSAMFAPAESVDADKINNLERAAQAVKKIYNITDKPRFDIIEVIFKSPRDFTVNHIVDAF